MLKTLKVANNLFFNTRNSNPRPIFDQTWSRLVNVSKRVDREKRLEQGRVVHVTVDCYSCPWIERRWDWIIPLPTRKQASTLGWIERDARIWLRITGLDSFTLLFRFLAHSRLERLSSYLLDDSISPPPPPPRDNKAMLLFIRETDLFR